jgi:hypothetical protein
MIDPIVISRAIERMESEISLFPEEEFPEDHMQVRAIVAALKEWLGRKPEPGIHDTASYC